MVVLGLVLGGLALEVALRLAGANPVPLSKRYLIAVGHQPRLDYHCYPTNPHGDFAPAPDVSHGAWRLIDFAKREYPLTALRQTPWVVEYEYSQQGTRDRAYGGPPAAGVLRIGGLGASFAFGEGVPLDKSLFRKMESRLGPNCEVVNAAWPGMKTAEMVALLPQLIQAYGCRRVLVVFTPNDILLTDSLQQRMNVINDLVNTRDLALQAHLAGKWYGHSWVLTSLMLSRELGAVAGQTKQWYLDCYDPRQNADNLERMRESIAALAAQRDCPVALVLYPLLIDLESGYPLTPIHELVGRMAREAGLPTLDLLDVFRGRRTSDLWVYATDHHPNSQAHALAAEATVSWLRTDVPGFLEIEDNGR
ncbi:MAG: hypothetical protein K1X74_07110 [Pirellulales bacterium]|nr:hypothetical protein [Pirellulales bacterium]